MKVLFLIRSLDAGGAERQLIELAKHLDRSLFDPIIVTFYDGGLLREEINKEDGIRLISLKKSGRWDVFHFFLQLLSVVRQEKPDLIHGYLDVANLFALLIGRLNGIKVIWGIRASDIDLKKYDWTANFVFRIAANLSWMVDCIIVNSQAGYYYHCQQGFSQKKMVIIPNGIDITLFYPDYEAGRQKRLEWGVGDETFLIGQVGRFDPMKAPENFIRAAAIISANNPNIRFVYIGDGPQEYRIRLQSMADESGLVNKFFWPGLQKDMRAVYNALDVLSLSSVCEGFPNAIGEGMACGIPCVVTNVGDAAWIVNECGTVVEPRNPEALAEGFTSMVLKGSEIRKKAGLLSRNRIETLFSSQTLIDRSQRTMLNLFQIKDRNDPS